METNWDNGNELEKNNYSHSWDNYSHYSHSFQMTSADVLFFPVFLVFLCFLKERFSVKA